MWQSKDNFVEFSPSTFPWVQGIELRLTHQVVYPLGHLDRPIRNFTHLVLFAHGREMAKDYLKDVCFSLPH